MAKLVDLYRSETSFLNRRQIPLIIDDNLTLVMDISAFSILCDNRDVRGKELEDIISKLSILTVEDCKEAFCFYPQDLQEILKEAVPCVGCRRSVERLYYQILSAGYMTLDPIVKGNDEDSFLVLREDKIYNANIICNLFHGHTIKLQKLNDSQPRSKKSQRCLLHSMDTQRNRTLVTTAWREVWDCMKMHVKEEVVLIENSALHATLEQYLRKHRFCQDCRAKVLKAFSLLVEEVDASNEKDYIPSLYEGIRRCFSDKHLHLQTDTDYIDDLISRAEPEVMGSRRERHAKTLEIAQEEVLTCLGICIYERLYRIYIRVHEQTFSCKMLAATTADFLARRFDTFVEAKRGITKLELLYEELTREERVKLHKQEKKKLKRRRKKEERKELLSGRVSALSNGDDTHDYEKENCKCGSKSCGLFDLSESNDSINEAIEVDSCSCDLIPSIQMSKSLSDLNGNHFSSKKETKKFKKLNNKKDTLCASEQYLDNINENYISCCYNGGDDDHNINNKKKTLASCYQQASDDNNCCSKQQIVFLDNCSCDNKNLKTTNKKKKVTNNIKNDSCDKKRYDKKSSAVDLVNGCNCLNTESPKKKKGTNLTSNGSTMQNKKRNDNQDKKKSNYSSSWSFQDKNNVKREEHPYDCGYASTESNGGGGHHTHGHCCETASISSSLPSSADSSDVSSTCLDGFCHHVNPRNDRLITCPNQFKLAAVDSGFISLQQMLDDADAEQDEDDNYLDGDSFDVNNIGKIDNMYGGANNNGSFISAKDLAEFKSKSTFISEKRQALRETLKQRFENMCTNVKREPRLLISTSASAPSLIRGAKN